MDVSERPGGGYDVKLTREGASEAEARALAADVLPVAGGLSLCIEGRSLDLVVSGATGASGGGARFAHVDGGYVAAMLESAAERATAKLHAPSGGSGGGVITSPMPGRVLKLLVAVGDEVAAGAPVAVVEAMKMENELRAERAGRVTKLHVDAGATVESGDPLVTLE